MNLSLIIHFQDIFYLHVGQQNLDFDGTNSFLLIAIRYRFLVLNTLTLISTFIYNKRFEYYFLGVAFQDDFRMNSTQSESKMQSSGVVFIFQNLSDGIREGLGFQKDKLMNSFNS